MQNKRQVFWVLHDKMTFFYSLLLRVETKFNLSILINYLWTSKINFIFQQQKVAVNEKMRLRLISF